MPLADAANTISAAIHISLESVVPPCPAYCPSYPPIEITVEGNTVDIFQ